MRSAHCQAIRTPLYDLPSLRYISPRNISEKMNIKIEMHVRPFTFYLRSLDILQNVEIKKKPVRMRGPCNMTCPTTAPNKRNIKQQKIIKYESSRGKRMKRKWKTPPVLFPFLSSSSYMTEHLGINQSITSILYSWTQSI